MPEHKERTGLMRAATVGDGPGEAKLGELEIALFRGRLRERTSVLREEIRQGLLKYDEDQYRAVADRVGDYEDHSVSDLLTDLDLSEIDRDVVELRETEAALSRIDAGVYGFCIDCEEPISLERLEKLPSAARCLQCQSRREHADPRPINRKL